MGDSQFGPMPEIQRLPAAAALGDIMAAFHDAGAVIIKEFLNKEELDEFNADLDIALETTPTGAEFADSTGTADLLGRNTKRLVDTYTKSKVFRTKIIEKELMHKVCHEIFGKDSGAMYGGGFGTYWINTAQVIQIGPGNKAQPLHRDHDQWPVFKVAGPNMPYAGCNFFFALSKFTDANGATRVRPGSHKWTDQGNYGVDTTIPVEMEPGDVCIFGSRLIHGGGANRTENEFRRGMALSMMASYLTPEDAHPFMISKALVEEMTPRGQQMIGWRTQYPEGTSGLWGASMQDIAKVINLKSDVPAL